MLYSQWWTNDNDDDNDDDDDDDDNDDDDDDDDNNNYKNLQIGRSIKRDHSHEKWPTMFKTSGHVIGSFYFLSRSFRAGNSIQTDLVPLVDIK